MEYSHNQYGDVFADIYDDWYHDLDNIADVVEFVLQLAESSAVLELGVGTGRLAIPIAQAGAARGVQVVGIDSSQAMLDELRAKPDGPLVETFLGTWCATCHLGHLVSCSLPTTRSSICSPNTSNANACNDPRNV